MSIDRHSGLTRRWRVIGLVCSWLSICIGASLAAAAEPATQCERTDTSEFRSPDGRWLARLYGESCDLGLSSSASVVVELARADDAHFRQNVLGMTMPSKKSGWPRVAWASPTKVLIDLPSSADIGLQMAYFQGVEIDVRLCPRDPANRARWLEYRASYRKWVKDNSAWIETKQRNPQAAGPPPERPTPPGAVNDPTCAS